MSPEAVHALLGKELSTEQRLKLSSTAIDAVIKGPRVEEMSIIYIDDHIDYILTHAHSLYIYII